jgi:hypothetical protein
VIPLADCNTVSVSGWISGSSGSYTRQGALNGRSYWKSSGNVYLYYASVYSVWIFDTDTNPSTFVDYLPAKSQFPPSGALWYYNRASRPIITCADSGTFTVSHWCCCSCEFLRQCVDVPCQARRLGSRTLGEAACRMRRARFRRAPSGAVIQAQVVVLITLSALARPQRRLNPVPHSLVRRLCMRCSDLP